MSNTRPFIVAAEASIFLNKKKQKSGAVVQLTKDAAKRYLASGHVEVDLDDYFDNGSSQPAAPAPSRKAEGSDATDTKKGSAEPAFVSKRGKSSSGI